MSKKKGQSSDSEKSTGPNQFPEAVTAKQKAALEASCRYLGHDYPEGATISYQGREWRCSDGTWVPE